MIIVLRISEQEDFHRSEIPLEKTREIYNEARISKKTEMKIKFNRNQKHITPSDTQLCSLTSLLCSESYIIATGCIWKLWKQVYWIFWPWSRSFFVSAWISMAYLFKKDRSRIIIINRYWNVVDCWKRHSMWNMSRST